MNLCQNLVSNQMKNIFVIPTNREPVKGDLLKRHIWAEKPIECLSWWLYKDTITIDNVKQYTTLNSSFTDYYKSFKVQNIYITSDEEIKEGDYVPWKNQIFKVDSQNAYSGTSNITLKYAKKYCKKIILTTDQDLIKDGVQAIDDGFLEWFVKNPSCEEVEVKLENYNASGALQPNLWQHKIIIPKEELNQDWYCPKCKSYVSTESVTFEETHQICNTGIVMKQETLEEVRVIKRTELYNSILSIVKQIPRKEVESDAMDAPSCAYELEQLFLKWQQERSYSEEEVKRLSFDFYYDMSQKMGVAKNLISENATNVDVWFEQFKKK